LVRRRRSSATGNWLAFEIQADEGPPPGVRRWNRMETVVYGRYRSVAEIPDLVEMQTKSYLTFLQPEVAANRRKVEGLEALLREIFPIYSYDKTLCIEYISYELGRPSS